jgi:hypothetical protein
MQPNVVQRKTILDRCFEEGMDYSRVYHIMLPLADYELFSGGQL